MRAFELCDGIAGLENKREGSEISDLQGYLAPPPRMDRWGSEVDQNAERGIANAQSAADKANQAAADAAKHGVDKLRTASSSKWASVKEATGLFRETS